MPPVTGQGGTLIIGDPLAALKVSLDQLNKLGIHSAEVLEQEALLKKALADESSKYTENQKSQVKAAYRELTRISAEYHLKEKLLSGDAGKTTLGIIQTQWQRITNASGGAFERLSGVSTEALGPLEGLATGLGAVIILIDELMKGTSPAIELQLSMASAGGAFRGSLTEMAHVTANVAMSAARWALDVNEVDNALNRVIRSSVLGNIEISRAAAVQGTSFTDMRTKLTTELADVTVSVLGLGPVFGKTTEQMTDMMIAMRSNLNVPTGDIAKQMLMLAQVSGDTGVNLDRLWEGVNKLGEQYRWVGVGIAPLTSSFATFGNLIKEMGAGLGPVNENSAMFNQLISDMVDSFAKMPIEQVTALEQLSHPGMGFGASVREAFKATPLERIMMDSNVMMKNMHGSQEDTVAALAVGLPEIAGHGAESYTMAQTLVKMQGESSKIMSMSAKDQTNYIKGIDSTLGTQLQNLAEAQRVTTGGVLKDTLQAIKNIESILNRFAGMGALSLFGGLIPGLHTNKTAVPSTSLDIAPGTGYSVKSAAANY